MEKEKNDFLELTVAEARHHDAGKDLVRIKFRGYEKVRGRERGYC